MLVMTVLVVSFCASSISAQFYFGKNKVQYTEFDWQVMTTEHFRIYFYTDETQVAQMAAKSAEDSYRVLAKKFNHEVLEKIPLIIYSSPSYFSQTNVIPGLLPESVGGFTEFAKGRVVVPYHGSYQAFDHVIRHELVHVFTLSKLDQQLDRNGPMRATYPPLWFTEGIAEFWSKTWDTEADMIVKDMVINNQLFTIPDLWQVRGTYFMYKLGESICTFIDSTYGSDKLTLIFENWTKGRDFDEVVKLTLGDDLNEVSRKWEYSLKKQYFPQIADHDLPKMKARQVTYDGYSVKGVPVKWDDGTGEKEWVVFKANRMGYSGIYMQPLKGGRQEVKSLIEGERSSKYESLYLLRSGIDVTDSGIVAFSSKSKERDVIYVYSLEKGSVVERYEFDSLVTIRSPRFSPDRGSIVFRGITKNGLADLYLLDLASGSYERLTNDVYNDFNPTFTQDSRAILFASDRCADGPAGHTNLYRLDLRSRHLVQLTFGPYADQSPIATRHGIFFASDRGGTFNLFLMDETGAMTQQTHFITGAFHPRLSSDGKALVFTGYQNLGFQIFHMDLPEEPKAVPQEDIFVDASAWYPDTVQAKHVDASVDYNADYSFDIAQTSLGWDPVYGALGGFQAVLTDMLGNHQFYFLLANTAETKDELLESFNVGVTYVNREHRINYALGGFHLYDEYFNDYDQYYFERNAGLHGSISYPISKFHRIDLGAFVRYSFRDRRFGLPDREAILSTNTLSWVYDNSLWDITGPIDGRRYNLTVGATTALDEARSWNRIALADIRHYFRLGRFSAFANRLFYYTSSGFEPQRIYFGGSWSFRGFDRREWYRRNVVFASNELRFPLIDRLHIGFPFGGIGFTGIRGALFFDVGNAWDEEWDQLLGSFGAGFRVALGYFLVLRFDFSRTTDFDEISPNTDFDFFFGWNF